ncbi:hypothetical protein KL942_005368 [Ogataea angusta]|uniref:Uncharacterized protein n=1 Tax=Pichia angusta TaxID=870730 RepID=A0ABQ7RPF1_PICAN|nr:hypothetical protein KL942_005368 [Ogataea angusta]KAG7845020.1 hypothetical protein KL940_005345 [Ogataea angusta]
MGEHFPIDGEDPSEVFDYATVMVIFVGAVFAYVFLITLVGPENKMVSLTHNIEEEEQEAGRESQKAVAKRPAIIYLVMLNCTFAKYMSYLQFDPHAALIGDEVGLQQSVARLRMAQCTDLNVQKVISVGLNPHETVLGQSDLVLWTRAPYSSNANERPICQTEEQPVSPCQNNHNRL